MKRSNFLFSGVFILLAIGPIRSEWFIRGDANPSGSINIADAIQVLQSLFLGDKMPLGCLDAADANDDGAADITDAAYLLSYLFLQGPRPGPEDLFTGCWYDRFHTPDDSLDCKEFAACNVGIFFCLDKSGSMVERSKLNRLKQETVKSISQLSENDQFAIIFFDANMVRLPATEEPLHATEEMKNAAISFVMSNVPGNGTCPLPALLAALQYAEKSTAKNNMIVLFTDGYPACPGSDATAYMELVSTTLAQRNTSGIPIYTIGMGSPAELPEAWLTEIAEQNHGACARLNF